MWQLSLWQRARCGKSLEQQGARGPHHCSHSSPMHLRKRVRPFAPVGTPLIQARNLNTRGHVCRRCAYLDFRCTGMYRHTYECVITHMSEIMGRDICQSDRSWHGRGDIHMSQRASANLPHLCEMTSPHALHSPPDVS